jgi:hypothetical protein
MTDDDLKPCPFCGGAAEFGECADTDEQNAGGHFIACRVCGATTLLVFACGDDPRPVLAGRWNKRHNARQPASTDFSHASSHTP